MRLPGLGLYLTHGLDAGGDKNNIGNVPFSPVLNLTGKK
jgi:hypothetical protein